MREFAREANRKVPGRILLVIPFAILCGTASAGTLPDREQGLARFDFRQIVKEAKAQVFPTVVFIKALRQGMEQGQKITHSVAGSGVIISPRGEVLSNWHVVERATEVRCLMQDGRSFSARVLGLDKDTDVALLQLELAAGTPDLSYAALGDSSRLTEGDFVMAFGAPFGLARSVSIGIVSCTRRYLPGASEYSIWLQTDASISPGNSGGPLVNTLGQVVGINTRGIAFGGGDTGFAVPIEVANDVAAQIRRDGRMDWSWIGLQLQPLRDFDRNIYFAETNGVVVAETDAGSPARRAGLQAGDRIVGINGRPVTGLTQEDLPAIRRQFGLLPKERPARIEIVRKGETRVVEVTPRAKGKVEGEQLDCPRWDFTVKAINQFDNPDLHFQRNEGVFVYGVRVPGNAATAGLSPRDILLRIDQQEVKTLEDVKAIHTKALANVQSKPRVILTVLRNGEMRQVVLDFVRQRDQE